jgi:hypothetical protein
MQYSKTKSEWREFAFALHQIQQAIDPMISLRKVLSRWTEISMALGESSRTREPQLNNYRFA